jgi:hypothetical protein
MPIPSEIRRRYYSKESGWPEIQSRILERSQFCCERCGAPRGVRVRRGIGGIWHDNATDRWIQPGDILVDFRPPCERGIVVPSYDGPVRSVLVQLGICHLNNQPGDDRNENLACWCRNCHLLFDAPFHKVTRQTRKDKARPLLTLCAEQVQEHG